MKPVIISMIILTAFTSCQQQKVNPVVSKKYNITLIDSAAPTTNLMIHDPKRREGSYPVYYIGDKKHTIKLGKHPIPAYGEYREDSIFRHKGVFFWPSNKLVIYVDTSISLTFSIYHWHYSGPQERISDSVNLVKSFPVFVSNESDSNLFLGYFNLINMVRQAKDVNGNWQNMEDPLNMGNMCGFGSRILILRPGQLAITKMLRYKGNFKTQCRLKMEFRSGNAIYSNCFYDYIDKRQLKDPNKEFNMPL